jgi:hypothetical protein
MNHAIAMLAIIVVLAFGSMAVISHALRNPDDK